MPKGKTDQQLENRLKKIESTLVEQEPRIIKVLQNYFINRKKWGKTDQRSKSAVITLVRRIFFSSTTVALAGSFIGFLTLVLLYWQVTEMREQTKHLQDQNENLQQQISQQQNAYKTARKTNLIELLDSDNNSVRHSAFLEFFGDSTYYTNTSIVMDSLYFNDITLNNFTYKNLEIDAIFFINSKLSNDSIIFNAIRFSLIKSLVNDTYLNINNNAKNTINYSTFNRSHLKPHVFPFSLTYSFLNESKIEASGFNGATFESDHSYFFGSDIELSSNSGDSSIGSSNVFLYCNFSRLGKIDSSDVFFDQNTFINCTIDGKPYKSGYIVHDINGRNLPFNATFVETLDLKEYSFIKKQVIDSLQDLDNIVTYGSEIFRWENNRQLANADSSTKIYMDETLKSAELLIESNSLVYANFPNMTTRLDLNKLDSLNQVWALRK